jgi:O-antigen/teichoic acid export membrane protein
MRLRTISGILSNWLSLALTYVVGFLLAPFVIHHLGSVAYGVWTIVLSLTSYMSLLDLGLRSAVVRFISRDHALGEHGRASETLSATFWLRLWVALFILIISVIISVFLLRFFHMSAEMQSEAGVAVVLAGLSLAITLLAGVFGGVLTALSRFDLLSVVSIGQAVLRAGGFVWLLKTAHHIPALAAWELLCSLVGGGTLWRFARWSYPELRLSFAQPRRETIKNIWRYSSYVFLMHIFVQVIYYTDNLVVGAFVSVSAVTFYAIGGSLSEYLRQIVASMTATFMPLAGRLEASGERGALGKLLSYGTRTALVVALPIAVALFFRGQTFIGVWVGEQYGPVSGRVLQILLLSQVFAIANSASINIALGLGQHRRCAFWAAGEAVANLSLSIIAIRWLGVYGVAIGTVIPNLAINVFLWPPFICRLLDVRLFRHVFQNWIKPLLLSVPYGYLCFWTDGHWSVHGVFSLFVQIGAILPIYLVFVLIGFHREIRELIRLRKQRPTVSETKVEAARP